MPTLEEFFSGKKKEAETPLMMRGVFPENSGTVTYNPEDYSKGIPVAGNLNKQGKVVAPIKNVDVVAPVREVVAPASKEVTAVAAEVPQIPQSRVDELKAIFSPKPVSELIDVNKVQMQAEQMAPKASWSDVLMGLIPVAADALAGGYGDALDVSGKYYGDKVANLEKRKQSLEDKLMEIEKSRALASLKEKSPSRRFQPKSVLDKKTGRSIYANYDTATGNFYLPDGTPLNASDIEVGFAVTPGEYDRRTKVSTEAQKERGDYFGRGVRLDPATGLLARVQNGKMIPIQVSDANLNPKQQRDLGQVVGKFTATDLYKKSAQVLGVASQVEDLLKQANDFSNASAASSARTQMSRMAGEVGALSDSDIERAGGSPSIKARAERFTHLQKSRVPLSPTDIREMREVARIYGAAARRKLNDAVALMEVDFVQNYGGVPGAVQTKMAALIPTTSAKPSVNSRKEESSKTPPPGMTFEQFKEWKKKNG